MIRYLILNLIFLALIIIGVNYVGDNNNYKTIIKPIVIDSVSYVGTQVKSVNQIEPYWKVYCDSGKYVFDSDRQKNVGDTILIKIVKYN